VVVVDGMEPFAQSGETERLANCSLLLVQESLVLVHV